jgi:hypothetical protein
MATDVITPEVVEAALAALFKAAERERQTSLRQAVEVRQLEAQTLRQEKDMLLKTLPADHPRVVALERMAQGAEEVATWAQETVERAEHHPDVRPGDWVILGRVVGPKGEPGKGLRIRVFDREQKFASRLGETSTDEHGEFFLRYSAEQFADLSKANPELFLMVMDAAGKTLFTSEEAFHAERGRVEQFEIRLQYQASTKARGRGPQAPKNRGR